MTKKYPTVGAVGRSRTLRSTMTDAERRVWNVLKSGDLAEFRFRRQVPIGPFIADFASHNARLIVEVDGGQHDPALPEEIRRTAFLNGEGYRVVRIWNNDALANAEGLYEIILRAVGSPPPNPPPSRGRR